MQQLFYEDVGRVKFGDSFALTVARKELRGLQPTVEQPLWNVWLAR